MQIRCFTTCCGEGYLKKVGILRGNGGERGIRTLGGLAPTTVFETAPFNHSGTSPRGVHLIQPGKPEVRQHHVFRLADLRGRGNSRGAEKYLEPDPDQMVQNLQRPC